MIACVLIVYFSELDDADELLESESESDPDEDDESDEDEPEDDFGVCFRTATLGLWFFFL